MTGYMFIQTTMVVCMHVVGLAMLLATWRLLRGPTVPDRILALDTLSVTAIAELMLFGMYLNSPIYFEAALIIASLVRDFDFHIVGEQSVRPVARLTTRPAKEISVIAQRHKD